MKIARNLSSISLMENLPPWAVDLLKTIGDFLPPFGGAMVAVIVGKDYSIPRIIGGVFSGLFMAWCFTDIGMHYVQSQFTIAPELYAKVYAALGAMIGMTGLALASRIIDLASTVTIPIRFKNGGQ